MAAITIINKVFHNAMRCFKGKVTRPQEKSIKRLAGSILEEKTAVLQHMHKADDKISAPKLRESLSNNLGKMEIREIVEKEAEKLIKKSKKYKGKNILSGDGTDIFKPAAKKMENLRVVKDGSTGLIGNGYIGGGININGISHQFHIKDPNEEEYVGDDRWKMMLEKSFRAIEAKETITVWDRGHDSVSFMKMVKDLGTEYVIIGKKNRILTLKDGSKKKCGEFEDGIYEVKLTEEVSCYLYVKSREGYKEAIRIYSSMRFETEMECIEIYEKRWKIEMDYGKMKGLGLEKVRLMKFKKVENMC